MKAGKKKLNVDELFSDFDPVEALGNWICVRLRKAAQMNVFGPLTPKERRRVMRMVGKSLIQFSERRYKQTMISRRSQRNMESSTPPETLVNWIRETEQGQGNNGKIELEIAEGGD